MTPNVFVGPLMCVQLGEGTGEGGGLTPRPPRRPSLTDIYVVTLRRYYGSGQAVKEVVDEIQKRPATGTLNG